MATLQNNQELVEKLSSLADLKFEKSIREFQISNSEKTITKCESDIKQLGKKRNALQRKSPVEVQSIPSTADIGSCDVILEVVDADLGINDDDFDEDASLEYETPQLDRAQHKMETICEKANSLDKPNKPGRGIKETASLVQAFVKPIWLLIACGFGLIWFLISLAASDPTEKTVFVCIAVISLASLIIKTMIVFFVRLINATKYNAQAEKEYAQKKTEYLKSVESYISTMNKYIADYNACAKSIYKCQLKTIESCIETAQKRITAKEIELEKLHSELAKIVEHIAESQYDYFDIRNYDGEMLSQMAGYLKEGRASTYQDAVNLYYQEEAQEQARREAREQAEKAEEARLEREEAARKEAAWRDAEERQYRRRQEIWMSIEREKKEKEEQKTREEEERRRKWANSHRCISCKKNLHCRYKLDNPDNCAAFEPK